MRRRGSKLSIVLGSGTQIGPDKIALLESIRDTGSISEAARNLGIQYKRAWMLLDSMNRAFRQPVVRSINGGAYAGAALTPFGPDVVERYRRIVAAAEMAATGDLIVLAQAALPDAHQRLLPRPGDDGYPEPRAQLQRRPAISRTGTPIDLTTATDKPNIKIASRGVDTMT